MDYRKGSHTVYNIEYHLVWVTKYRYHVLTGDVQIRVRELIRQTCASLDVYIVKGHIAKDHVQLLVSVPPNLALRELVKRLKGRSSRKLLQEYDELRREFWGRHLWARGYFGASTGNGTDEIVAEYIEKQARMAPEDQDQDFHMEGEL